MRPLLLRPPLRLVAVVNDFSGVPFVTSAKSASRAKRRPGTVGLNCVVPILLLPHREVFPLETPRSSKSIRCRSDFAVLFARLLERVEIDGLTFSELDDGLLVEGASAH